MLKVFLNNSWVSKMLIHSFKLLRFVVFDHQQLKSLFFVLSQNNLSVKAWVILSWFWSRFWINENYIQHSILISPLDYLNSNALINEDTHDWSIDKP